MHIRKFPRGPRGPDGGLHVDRVARGDRHHRGFDRLVVAGRSSSAGSGPAGPMCEQPRAKWELAIHNYESSIGTFPPTTILIPTQSGAPGTWAYQSSWSVFARSAPFMEQGNLYNSINYDFTYSDPTNTTVTFSPISYLFCPSDPGHHNDDASMGNTGDATTSYRHLRRAMTLVRFVSASQLGLDQFRRPPESQPLWAELCAPDRRRDGRFEQHLGHFRGVDRPCSNAKLPEHSHAPLGRERGNVDSNERAASGTLLVGCSQRADPFHAERRTARSRPVDPSVTPGGPIAAWQYYSGFTTATAFAELACGIGVSRTAPNLGANVPMDWDSTDENDGGPTYMSLSASSQHPGGVRIWR